MFFSEVILGGFQSLYNYSKHRPYYQENTSCNCRICIHKAPDFFFLSFLKMQRHRLALFISICQFFIVLSDIYGTEVHFLLHLPLGAATLVLTLRMKSRKCLAYGAMYTCTTHAGFVHDFTDCRTQNYIPIACDTFLLRFPLAKM